VSKWWRQNGWMVFYPAVAIALTCMVFLGFLFLAEVLS